MGRRLLIILAGVAALLLGLLPGVIGVLLEQAHPELVESLRARLQPHFLQQVRFQRGWFRSQLDALLVTAGGEPIQIQADLGHGPWAGGPGWLQLAGHGEHPAHGSVGRLSARIGLAGGVTGRGELSWPDDPGLGLVARFDLARSHDVLLVEFDRGHLALARTSIPKFEGQLRVTGLARPPLAAVLTMEAPEADLGAGLLEAVAAQLTLDADGDTADLGFGLTAARWNRADAPWQSFELGLALESLHQDTTLGALQRIGQALDARPAPDPSSVLSSELLLSGPTLLKHRPRLVLNTLNWIAPEGPGRAGGLLTLSAPPPGGFLADPSLLLPVLMIEARLRAPQPEVQRWALALARIQAPWAGEQAWAATADDLMARWRGNRLLVADGEDYRMQISLAEEALVINDQPMVLPSF